MKKRLSAFILSFVILLSSLPLHIFANDIDEIKEIDNTLKIGEVGGYLAGAVKTISKTAEEQCFSWSQGHGFAAEQANNFADRLKGLNATVVGGDNLKNGPDRKIINRDGTVTWIQDKYYQTASGSLEAAFDDVTGLYRYIDGDGTPMQLEIPADQYDDVVKGFSKKIQEGKVPGVTDPDAATNYVRKGKYTYQQAKNLTKAGNIDSLVYDAQNGIITASCAMGITFVLDFASCMINGQKPLTALKEASLNGLKSGGIVFATYVISSQLCKSGLKSALAPTAEAVAGSFGKDLSAAILATCGKDAAAMTATQVTKEVANILSSQIIVEAVVIVVLTIPDVVDLCRGRISAEQLLKNLSVAILSAAGSVGGAIGGATIGSAIGNVPGGIIGGIIGGIAGGTGVGFGSEWLLSKFLKDDADKMYEIITQEFQHLAEDYLLTQKEADEIIDKLKDMLSGNKLKDMYESKDRNKFAIDLMEPLFQNQVKKRAHVTIPTEGEVRDEMISSLQGIVFLH